MSGKAVAEVKAAGDLSVQGVSVFDDADMGRETATVDDFAIPFLADRR